MDSLLSQYVVVVNFLGKALGEDYEIVLHDLTQTDSRVIAISNGNISGRDINSPLTNAAVEMLASKVYDKCDYLNNYKGLTEDGRLIRSSTMFIKNDVGEPIGLLCINFDASRYNNILDNLKNIIHPQDFIKTLNFDNKDNGVENPVEKFSTDIDSLMNRIYEDTIKSVNIPTDRLTQPEKIKIISELEKRGIFKLKGSVQFISKKLSCSAASIYRYIGEINRD